MTERLDEHALKGSDTIAELVNKTLNEYLSTGVVLTSENLSQWATDLVSLALTTALPGIWQMATDTVAEVFLSGETEGLGLTPEQATEAGEWILSWDRVDEKDAGEPDGE